MSARSNKYADEEEEVDEENHLNNSLTLCIHVYSVQYNMVATVMDTAIDVQ